MGNVQSSIQDKLNQCTQHKFQQILASKINYHEAHVFKYIDFNMWIVQVPLLKFMNFQLSNLNMWIVNQVPI
jgi:hypothetical protein